MGSEPTDADRRKAGEISRHLDQCICTIVTSGFCDACKIIAHALAAERQAAEEGQREADAKIAEREGAVDCSYCADIASAIRTGGGGV